MHPLETYITRLRDIHLTYSGVQETSYYGRLEELLNEVGKELKPKVHCVMQLKNQGAGIPDGGLFTPDQFQKGPAADVLPGQLPSRGAIEVKGPADDVRQVARTKQVEEYCRRYGQVLVTNLREFLLVERDESVRPVELERYTLAGTETEFWAAAAHPHKMVVEHGDRLVDYLKRVMRHQASLSSPEDLAWYLASYAREARARVESASGLPALASVRAALEEALGLRFEGEKGEHFFRSTLVQTLFYGVFSAWVLWHKKASRHDHFDWRIAGWYLHVPVITALFNEIATSTRMEPLGLVEVLDWAGMALNRVAREEFFKKFEEEHAVQYFYEPFLKAYDPDLRKEMGVWYTPPEIVEYMVERVDAVLRSELGIDDGLADPRVYVLDPCCGTGAYLVRVLKRIARTLRQKGGDALLAHDLKEAAIHRVFGFEIMPAPFVISHLQLGILLQTLGAPLSDAKSERAGVYLTNSLTGWNLPTSQDDGGPNQATYLPELTDERDAAGHVKRDAQILVVLGNPPYNAFSGVSPEEEQGLVEPYKAGLISQWGIKKFNLDDLYIRFFRLAEHRIAQMTGQGVVCYISNFSYLSDPSYVVMRRRFLSEFDKLWFDCMNGDSRETGKLTPEGKPDPSVFSTEHNREGIRVGTAIGLMVRRKDHEHGASVRFRHFWGVNKRTDLLASLKAKDQERHYQVANPSKANRHSFRPADEVGVYDSWPKLVDLCAQPPSNGLMEKRRGALIDIDKDGLDQRMRIYYDPVIDWETLRGLGTGFTEDAARFDAKKARTKVVGSEAYIATRVKRYLVRPFDVRWCYYTPVRPLWNEPRPSLWAQCWEGNTFLMSRPAGVAEPEGVPLHFASALGDNDFLRGHAYYYPIRLLPVLTAIEQAMQPQSSVPEPIANLSTGAREYLASLGVIDPDADEKTAGLVWMHALAIGCSPAYLSKNAGGIRQDWPRIPLPDSRDALEGSAAVGRRVAALLDTERDVPGVTTGGLKPELVPIGAISRVGGGALDPDADLNVTAGWGHAGQGGVTMPGKGKIVEREYTGQERAAMREQATERLGRRTRDVYLNDVAYWRNVPDRVWEYTIGGYQVIKKWLSYRERPLLGRSLKPDEAREVMNIARRIAAILLMEPDLDANYHSVCRSTYAWPGRTPEAPALSAPLSAPGAECSDGR